MKTKLGPDMLCELPTMNTQLAKLREKRAKGKKLKVGVYGITGCAGCQLTILFSEKFTGFLNMVDVLAIPFIKEKNYKGKFDVIILEGLVACEADKKVVEELRERCDVLVCIGACAVHGCVPAMKNFMSHPEVERAVYAKVDYLNALDATPVSKHVPVDIELPGCPPDANQIYAVLTDLVLGRPPRTIQCASSAPSEKWTVSCCKGRRASARLLWVVATRSVRTQATNAWAAAARQKTRTCKHSSKPCWTRATNARISRNDCTPTQHCSWMRKRSSSTSIRASGR